MREILFRGKTKHGGEWVYGGVCCSAGNTIIVSFSERILTTIEGKRVLPETVGQYTGLTDKNGKKIFEGDICRFREWAKGEMCWVGKVHYEHQHFVISGNPNKECESPFLLVMSRFISENIEIIGNIHDTPELLEGGE